MTALSLLTRTNSFGTPSWKCSSDTSASEAVSHCRAILSWESTRHGPMSTFMITNAFPMFPNPIASKKENKHEKPNTLWAYFTQWIMVAHSSDNSNTVKPCSHMIRGPGLNREVLKIADIKLFRIAKTKSDCKEFQKDLSKLPEWATKWQMQFYVRKATVQCGACCG